MDFGTLKNDFFIIIEIDYFFNCCFDFSIKFNEQKLIKGLIKLLYF